MYSRIGDMRKASCLFGLNTYQAMICKMMYINLFPQNVAEKASLSCPHQDLNRNVARNAGIFSLIGLGEKECCFFCNIFGLWLVS